MSEESKSLEEKIPEGNANSPNQNNDVTIKKSTYKNMLKGIVIAIAIAAFFGGYSVGTLDNSEPNISGEQLKELLSDIQANPQPAQQPNQPSEPQIVKASLDDDPVKGDHDAPVTIIEFSDFQCPFCSRFYVQTLPLLQENYIDTGKVKLVYRDFPIDNLHPNARPAHIAAECADEQGKFWEYHDVLFEKQAMWQQLSSSNLQSTLSQYATDLGLQTASFETCLESQDVANEVNKDYLDGGRYGASGTPTFFIGNEKDGFVKLVGAQPYSAFQAVIDSQLG